MTWLALLLGAACSAWLMASVGGGWVRGAPGYAAWALLPYAGLLLSKLAMLRWPAHPSVERVLQWITVLLAILGPTLYVDILFVHVDAQGALAMLVVPAIQTGLWLAAIVLLAIWQWRIARRGVQTIRAGPARPPSSNLLSRRSMGWKQPLRYAVAAAAILGALAYAGISCLQYRDAGTIDTAREVDFYIREYCKARHQLPGSAQLHARFPGLSTDHGWFFYTVDGRTNWLRVQYPVRWWNRQAIGSPRISEFTATAYAYSLEYRCGGEP
jgi:hypothetical protein